VPQLSLAYVGGWMTRCLSRSWWKHQIIEFGILAASTKEVASTTTTVTVICTDRVAWPAARLSSWLICAMTKPTRPFAVQLLRI
jgi:hypothetical protein